MIDPEFEKELSAGVRQLIASCSGLPPTNVIPGNDNAPRPQTAYATVLLIDSANLGLMPDETIINHAVDNLHAITVANLLNSYSVQFFGTSAVQVATKTWQTLHSSFGRSILSTFEQTQKMRRAPLGLQFAISYGNHSILRKIDAIIDKKFEERAGFDLRLQIMYDYINILDGLDNINLDSKLDN